MLCKTHSVRCDHTKERKEREANALSPASTLGTPTHTRVPKPNMAGAIHTVAFVPNAGMSTATIHPRNTISSVTGACASTSQQDTHSLPPSLPPCLTSTRFLKFTAVQKSSVRVRMYLSGRGNERKECEYVFVHRKGARDCRTDTTCTPHSTILSVTRR